MKIKGRISKKWHSPQNIDLMCFYFFSTDTNGPAERVVLLSVLNVLQLVVEPL